jgi:hypothetical protein
MLRPDNATVRRPYNATVRRPTIPPFNSLPGPRIGGIWQRNHFDENRMGNG